MSLHVILCYSTQTPTIYWKWLRQTLILTRPSSLDVGMSRSVMSDQREQITVQDTPTPTHKQLSESKSRSLASWVKSWVWVENHILCVQRHQIQAINPRSYAAQCFNCHFLHGKVFCVWRCRSVPMVGEVCSFPCLPSLPHTALSSMHAIPEDNNMYYALQHCNIQCALPMSSAVWRNVSV